MQGAFEKSLDNRGLEHPNERKTRQKAPGCESDGPRSAGPWQGPLPTSQKATTEPYTPLLVPGNMQRACCVNYSFVASIREKDHVPCKSGLCKSLTRSYRDPKGN